MTKAKRYIELEPPELEVLAERITKSNWCRLFFALYRGWVNDSADDGQILRYAQSVLRSWGER